ncbi:cellulose synthase family protein [Flavobacterium soyangense]|uniref:Glycosyltransferase n=1 Tax=Flavobacterium soyangense TaxID=2023265 RepID=A0A930U9V3_9FLAO|nr:cellulose synthase family protein [Flavobacterium soyangense]MBF2709603.1 glycosyltransferase [Flavobacterium soyangense]
MVLILSYLTLFFYSLAILLIFFYSLAQLNLLINYLQSKKSTLQLEKFNFSNPDEIPLVTIQLPIYNEKYVVQRLIDNIVLMDYPKGKLEIQVLDDSTDDSVLQTINLVNKYADQGIDIKHITRQIRTGYKAGALKEGLLTAKGEFIAIFDADFMPQKDWLFKTIPSFKDPKVGVVQTRWGHLNRNYSVLTRIQAFALDAHFTLEQTGRNSKQHCINFNGTAGIWRKSCIIDAGNWESDTLTEDLDLSYRAQLKNWKFVYLEDVETPAELPAIISAARSQQFRWNKGGAENFKKMASKVIHSKTITAKTKFHGILHLLNSSMFLAIFAMSILSVPMLFVKNYFDHIKLFFDIMTFFIITSVIFFTCYWFTFKNIQGSGFKNFLKYVGLFFTFYSIAMGFSFQNSIAVLEGFIGKKSEFVRTPKFNIETLKEKWKDNIYMSRKISKNTIVEGLLIFYFLFGLYSGFKLNDYALYPFHLMLLFGYSYVFVQSVKSN